VNVARIAPDRVWPGQVRTPARFVVHAVHADRVIGVWNGEHDVEHVRANAPTVISSTRESTP
jgi:hypothetical protein